MGVVTERKARGLIQRFEEAVHELAWIGSKHPGDHEGIRAECDKRRNELLKALTSNSA